MNIHYVVTSLETGGAEFAIPDIVKTLEQFGHQVDVTACEPRDMGAAPHLEQAGIPYHLLDSRRRSFFLTLIRLLRLLRRNRPDIIWTSLSRATLLGQLAGALLNIPVVSWKNSASIRFTTTAGRRITRLWVADSAYVARFLREKMNIPPEKITSWPLYVAAPENHPAPDWNGGTPLHIGSTGRLHEVKNYPLLIEGLALFRARHPQWADLVHLSFAGDGPQRAELETLIRQHGLENHVSLKGFQTDVPAFLRTLQLYAQPSRYEGMCLAAHEAMNMSLPVMATPVGEMRNSVQPGQTGFLLQPDRIPETFCDTLAEIFQNPALLNDYGKAAKRYIEQHYSREAFTQRCGKIVEKLERMTTPQPSGKTPS
ncbi:glycosyltransferase family 4 protein [Parasaccharibacter apium]|uniref:Glycosyltransferase n=1 Tax=Parasaccharibacter apium TaxID=1510841 RepID=A0ABX4ZKY2_9PROT|nr:glycosyltransferase family 4 protein [Parasaccharibacter apium]POS61848.1 glycosyltransferase [Parasaccharibacter apium]POS62768.1 glycosyltransferase [Parasaccharibacter apium]POS63228.1 glycosyltransferase [Parasaccharibacter apium]